MLDGELLGLFDGDFERDLLGLIDGELLGLFDGDLLGLLEGLAVGLRVVHPGLSANSTCMTLSPSVLGRILDVITLSSLLNSSISAPDK